MHPSPLLKLMLQFELLFCNLDIQNSGINDKLCGFIDILIYKCGALFIFRKNCSIASGCSFTKLLRAITTP